MIYQNNTKNKKAVNFVYDGSRHRVASIHPGGVLKRTITNRHILKNPQAICFDLTCLKQMQNSGVQKIIVRNREAEETYKTTMNDFMRRSFDIHYPPYPPQKALKLEDWDIDKPEGTQPRLF